MTVKEVLDQIDEQRTVLIKLVNRASKNPVPPNKLSDVGIKLSTLNELLGGHLAKLKRQQIEKEREIFNAAKAEGKTDTAANAAARFGTVKERYAFETVDNKHSDLWKLISMFQSHIRAEGEERKAM